MKKKIDIQCGVPSPLGASPKEDGVNFAVFSDNATRIELCLFSKSGLREETRITLPERTGSIFHGFVPGAKVGDLYGYRAHGPYAPDQGHRFNPNKLLLDPYTRELRGKWVHDDRVLGYDARSADLDLSFDSRNSAAFVPKSVVSDPALFSLMADRDYPQSSPNVIYEAHVKGLTQTHPGVADAVKGTYEGLASDAVIEHLHKLSISSIELLPVHSFVNDGFLLEKGLTNYWGYNSIGFFAPEPRYFGPTGLLGFKKMVQAFHAADIEVILDVVYNHTAEGDHRGPTLCYRGLDNASYYRLIAGQPRYYVNDTGCGNTLNVSHPSVLRMVMDSLRFWVQCMGIDGFRFDLATTLGRESHGFDPNGGFFDALKQDPVLANVRLIAEPWDVGPGGYQLGEYPAEFSEWNDAYRDTVRRYWNGDSHSAQELGARLLGSADRFDRSGRRAWSSINLVSSHDGFTLADVTRYEHQHNELNLENNQDGHSANYSSNGGVEGATDDPEIRARRSQRQRNMLATLLLSQGTPMLLAGDEISNSQEGNNNAYCQDNEIGWINWPTADEEMLSFVAKLSAFRATHNALSQSRFLHGGIRAADELPDVEWTDFQGNELQWRDSSLSNLCLIVRCSAETSHTDCDNDVVFIIFNRDDKPAQVHLPDLRKGMHWVRHIDTAAANDALKSEDGKTLIQVLGNSVVALAPDVTPNVEDEGV